VLTDDAGGEGRGKGRGWQQREAAVALTGASGANGGTADALALLSGIGVPDEVEANGDDNDNDDDDVVGGADAFLSDLKAAQEHGGDDVNADDDNADADDDVEGALDDATTAALRRGELVLPEQSFAEIQVCVLVSMYCCDRACLRWSVRLPANPSRPRALHAQRLPAAARGTARAAWRGSSCLRTRRRRALDRLLTGAMR
jgi:hypothetical protein